MRRSRALATALCVLGVSACAPVPEIVSAAAPPDPQPLAIAQEPTLGDSVRAHFERQEQTLRGRGLMRTDAEARDIPFGVNTLVRNFDRIALRDEYVLAGGRLIERETGARLRRWDRPVRLALEFGEAVPPEQRAIDSAQLRDLAVRLGRITGHPVTITEGVETANFRVLVLTEEERRAIGPRLRALIPSIDATLEDTIANLPLSVSCMVIGFARAGTHVHTQAVAVIRAELPELTRTSCFHEEIAQGLGLPNDSAAARPSIFNDSLEFAVLTRHDEALLRILYDPRLQPGMGPAEARPIVEAIAVELLGGES
ncbi:DUF2927 domain-containing protein [Rhodobaculum claviforme]|nr:DUF2927 domain-containing protein [Rhodobaculum claviforme]